MPIIVCLAHARKMIELLSSRTYRNKKEIAEMFGMSMPNVSRTLRSAFLSLVIVSGAIPFTRFAAVSDRLIALPLWVEQHALLGIE